MLADGAKENSIIQNRLVVDAVQIELNGVFMWLVGMMERVIRNLLSNLIRDNILGADLAL